MHIARSTAAIAAALISLHIISAVAREFQWAGWSVIALTLYIYTVMLNIKFQPQIFLLMLPLQFLFLSELSSASIIEFGAYMFEVDQNGSPTGGTAALAALYVSVQLFITVLFPKDSKIFNKLSDRPRYSNELSLSILYLLIGAALLYFLYVGMNSGFPLLLEQDRFNYRREVNDPIFTSLFGNRLSMAFLLGIGYQSPHRSYSGLLMALLLLLSALLGEKFTSIALMVVFFLIPIATKAISEGRKLRVLHLLLGGLIVLSITVPLILLVYGARDSFNDSVERLASRVAVQGQMWFVVHRDNLDMISLPFDVAGAEATSLVTSSTDTLKYGRYAAMAPYASSELLNWVMSIDQGFVFTLLPSWRISYGSLGTQVLVIFTVFPIVLCLILLAISMKNGNLILAAVSSKAFTWIIAGFVNGYSFHIFGIKTLFALTICILLLKMKKLSKSKLLLG